MATEDKTESDAGVPIDWQAARNFTGGDDALLDELLQMFPEESEKHLEAIRAAIEQNDGPVSGTSQIMSSNTSERAASRSRFGDVGLP